MAGEKGRALRLQRQGASNERAASNGQQLVPRSYSVSTDRQPGTQIERFATERQALAPLQDVEPWVRKSLARVYLRLPYRGSEHERAAVMVSVGWANLAPVILNLEVAFAARTVVQRGESNCMHDRVRFVLG
ncbi:hypothetical protein [Paraburkholderia sp. MM5482-R1]|uniref:hypothetical protein n=1 Tax=unclassified Paraburkholderia TaxID=2615204 RepID=UPI003D1D6780